jgi:hypothetical protein
MTRKRRRRTCKASPATDARSLAGMVIRGAQSREATLSLILLSARDENILRRKMQPNDFMQLAQYRREVLEVFEKIIAGDDQAPLGRRRTPASGRNCPQLPENRNELTHAI